MTAWVAWGRRSGRLLGWHVRWSKLASYLNRTFSAPDLRCMVITVETVASPPFQEVPPCTVSQQGVPTPERILHRPRHVPSAGSLLRPPFLKFETGLSKPDFPTSHQPTQQACGPCVTLCPRGQRSPANGLQELLPSPAAGYQGSWAPLFHYRAARKRPEASQTHNYRPTESEGT